MNDENLTPADFLDDLNVSPDICASPQTKISNACCTDFKTENGDQFKTPVTSRYSHKITETPCLFSQDESTTCIYSPTSSKYSRCLDMKLICCIYFSLRDLVNENYNLIVLFAQFSFS